MATELVLIRHGQAVRGSGNYLRAPLTELGRGQAVLTGKYLRGAREHFNGFYSSPLRRARETADLIGEQIGCEPQVQTGLQEMAWVEFPPLLLLETVARFRVIENYLRLNAGLPLRWPIIGRVSQVLTGLIARHDGWSIALVTHGGVISATLSWYMPERRRYWWRETVDNCSVTRLKVEGRTAELVSFNDTRHLKQEVEAQPVDLKAGTPSEPMALPTTPVSPLS